MSLAKLQTRLKELYRSRKEINEEIDKTYREILPTIPWKFGVSDHAIVEYQQDIELLPVSEVRFKILSSVETFFDEHPTIDPETLKKTIYKLLIGGMVYVINNYKVITVYPTKDKST